MGWSLATLKYVSLATLTIQGSAFALVLRVSRTQTGPKYLASTSVLMTELMKFFLCIFMALYDESQGFRNISTAGVWRRSKEIVLNCGPMAIPATLYVIQQTLLITGASHLDAVSFQICVNLKVVPTALFAVIMLGKNLSLRQWLSLPVMAVGVAFATIANHQQTAAMAATKHQQRHDAGMEDEEESEVWMLGVMACLVAGIMSGYASVYFEKNIKVRDSQTTLWVKNIQLGIFGCSLAVLSVMSQDYSVVRGGGLMQGFGVTAWSVVVLQAAGGLLVAAVVKFADNILKGFANAVSVILSWVVSIPLFGLYPTPLFLAGLALVLLSMHLYNHLPVVPKPLASESQGLPSPIAVRLGLGGEGGNDKDHVKASIKVVALAVAAVLVGLCLVGFVVLRPAMLRGRAGEPVAVARQAHPVGAASYHALVNSPRIRPKPAGGGGAPGGRKGGGAGGSRRDRGSRGVRTPSAGGRRPH